MNRKSIYHLSICGAFILALAAGASGQGTNRLWIEADSMPDPDIPNPIGQMVFGAPDTAGVWAVLRDSLNNLIGFSAATQWISTDTFVAKVTSGNPAMGEGVVVPGSGGAGHDSAWIVARNAVDTTLQDSFRVVISNVAYDSLRIMRYVPPLLVQVYQLYDTIPNSTTLYVQAHRIDGLGGNGGWVDVMGSWPLSASFTGKTSTFPPASSNSWTFAPTDTGTGTISVSVAGVPSPAVLDPVMFFPGAPNVIRIYPQAGTPDVPGNMPWPDTPAVADTMSADSTYTLLYAKLFCRTPLGKEIWLSQYETDTILGSQIIWSANGPRDTITAFGSHAELVSRQARRAVTVTASCNTLSCSSRIYVAPGVPDHIVIEGQAGPAAETSVDDNPLAQITLGPSDTTFNAIYAIVRDRFGNFWDYSHNPDWWSNCDSIIQVIRGSWWNTIGQGTINRVSPDGGDCFTYVRDLDYPSIGYDSVRVVIGYVPYDSLRITLRDPVTFLDTVQIPGSPPTYTRQSGFSETFYMQARRAMINTWENVSGDWLFATGLGSTTAINQHGVTISAIDTSTGILTATFGSLSASVTIEIVADAAASLVIYTDSLPPAAAGNAPKPNPPQVVSMAAGSIDTLAALVFDNRGVFLPQYLNDTERLSISWTAISRTFGDTLTSQIFGAPGPVKYFAPTRAYDTVLVIASLNNLIRDTVLYRVYQVVPLDLHMVIEASSTIQNLIADDPLAQLVIPATDTSASVYAIIRDRWGNFLNYSTTTQWISTDTSILIVRQGDSTTGQGIVIRRADFGQAFVIAVDTSKSPGDTLRDTVEVVLACQCAYINIRISIFNPYTPNVDTIRIPVNDSLILYAELQRTDDTSQWEPVAVLWAKDTNLITSTNQPALPSSSWTVIPASLGSGRIRVTYDLGFFTLSDSAWVVFYDPSSVRDNSDRRLHLDSWRVFSDNGRVRIRIPAQGVYNIKIYSLAGHLVDSRATSKVEESFRVPAGAYIVSVGRAGSRQETRKRVVAIGR
jgi:hypothetical protein